MMMIMTRYQPGSRSEKEALLQRITYPEACWTVEQALPALKMWKRRIERARELEVTIPDPSILLSALDAVTEKSMKKDPRRLFRVESTRQSIKVDVVTTLEAVEQLSIVLEGELEQCVSTQWTKDAPKVNSINGNPKGKGKTGKDGKGKDGKGKDGKGKDKGKEPCYYFTETEEGCNKGQHCQRHHRMLKP
jgi:hypothetical protein